jgi:hypothetical protein
VDSGPSDRSRLLKAKADIEELKVQELDSRLVSVDAMAKALSSLATTIRTRLLAIPTEGGDTARGRGRSGRYSGPARSAGPRGLDGAERGGNRSRGGAELTSRLRPGRRRTPEPSRNGTIAATAKAAGDPNAKTPGTGPGAIGRERPEVDDRLAHRPSESIGSALRTPRTAARRVVRLLSPLFTARAAGKQLSTAERLAVGALRWSIK